VVVTDYDTTGKEIPDSTFNMSPTTALAGTSIPATNTNFKTFPENN